MIIKHLSKNLPLEERKAEYKKVIEEKMNPIPKGEFDPNNFEPLASAEEKEVAFRKRVKPPKTLPTFGLEPKEILEGQLIGMYESKQDIYLVMAHRCNELQNEINGILEKMKNMQSEIDRLSPK